MHPHEQPGVEANFPCVGRWRLTALPRGWMVISNFGIRQMSPAQGTFCANIALGGDALGSGDTLESYMVTQTRLINNYLRKAAMAGPHPVSFAGADQAALVMFRHRTQNDISVLHVQTYVCAAGWVGIITLTTQEADLKTIRPEYDDFVRGLRFNLASSQIHRTPVKD